MPVRPAEPCRRAGRVAVVVAMLGATACGGDSNGISNPPPGDGSFSVALSGSSLSVARSANGAVTVTVTRTGSFTGAVNLSVSGAPNGVTASFAPAQVASEQTTSTLTIAAGASASTGVATLTITASAAGLSNQTATLQLTVTAPTQAGPFSLAISASSFLFHPSNQIFQSPLITITRHAGFTGAVTFAVTGLPPTLFLGFTPSSATGATTTVVPLDLGGTPNGTYTATITGTAAGQGTQSVTLQLVVAPTSTGSIRWKYCSASMPRLFFAVRDGGGPWTRIMPAADTSFSFNITSGSGSVAEVFSEGGGFRMQVSHYTAQEMAARAASQCQLAQNVTSRTANGSFGGVTGFRMSLVGMGWWFGSANGNGAFTLLNLPPGPLDVVAVRGGELVDVTTVPLDRMIVRRGLNPASGGTIPVLDFGAAESFAPATATWTFTSVGTDQFGVSQMFTTAGGSIGMFSPIPAPDGAAAARTMYGVPFAQTIAGDLHQVIATVFTNGVTIGSPNRATRQVVAYSRTLADRTLALPPALPAPTVSVLSGAPAGRLRAQGTLPAELNTGVSFDLSQESTSKHATVVATRGFLGAGSAYDVAIPDLTGVIGWDSRYQLHSGAATNWWVSGGGPVLDFADGRFIFNSTRSRWAGAHTGVTAPADGATHLMSRVFGTSTP